MAPTAIPDGLVDSILSTFKFKEARRTGTFFGTFTPEVHHEFFRKLDAEYRASPCAKGIEHLIRSLKPAEGWPIENAVAFGLCSFSAVYWSEQRPRFYKQLASFLHIVEIIQEGMETPLSKYAQEPLFQDSDTIFLEQLGVEVVESPAGLSLINAKTFAYCPFLPRFVPVLQQSEQPILYMGNEVRNAIWMVAGQLFVAEKERVTFERELALEVASQIPGGVGSLTKEEPRPKFNFTTDDGPDAPLQRHTKSKEDYERLKKDLDALIAFKNSRAIFNLSRSHEDGTSCIGSVCLLVHVNRSILGPGQEPPALEKDPHPPSYPWIEWPLE